MKQEEIVGSLTLFNIVFFQSLKCKGEDSIRIINLKGGEIHSDRIQRNISKRVIKDT